MRVRLITIAAVALYVTGVSLAHASSLTVKSNATGGGTIVHNGSGSVGTTNDSSDGDASAWSTLGFDSASDFLIIGSISQPSEFNFDHAILTNLLAIATVTLPFDCDGQCADFPLQTLASVNLANSPIEGGFGSVVNVAWVGHLFPLPTNMTVGTSYLFQLDPGDPNNIQKLDNLIALVGADNVHIGLSAALNWPTQPVGNQTDPGTAQFDTVSTPEPASLILLGSGLAGFATAARGRFRRRRDHSGPGAPDKMKLPQ